MKDLYYFDSRYLSNSFQAKAIGIDEEEESLDDHNNLIIAVYKGIIFPVVFHQFSGKKFTDILTTGWPNLFLISDRLKNFLEEHHFTGWKTYPIILKDKKNNQIEGYHGLSVSGISGRIDYTNSPIIEKRWVPEGPIVKEYKGANIDLDKWNETDFFVPGGTTAIVIKNKVAQMLKKNKITNLHLTNVAEEEMPIFLLEKMSPYKGH